VVAGLLVERVTGTSIVRQLQRRLIRPLGLRHSWFPTDTAALPPPRLHGHMPLDTEPPLVDADITRFNPSFFWASGALVSNVDDLDRFYDALFDGRLLPRRLLAEMLTPVDTGVPGWGYGLGLEEYTLPWGVVVGHTGPCPATTPGRSGCSATTRTPAWSPTSTRPRTRCTKPSSTPWSRCSVT
jgi:D-alanyl-D-alanine carboxypeptidase